MRFNTWRNKGIDCWELSDDIHKFDEDTFKLAQAYHTKSVDELYMIARAFANDFLQKEEIPSEALEIVEGLTEKLF